MGVGGRGVVKGRETYLTRNLGTLEVTWSGYHKHWDKDPEMRVIET